MNMITPNNITCGYFDSSSFGSLTYSPKRKVTKYEIDFYLNDGSVAFADDRAYPIKKDYIQIGKPGQIRFSKLPFSTAHIKFNASGEIADLLEKAPEYFCSSHPKQIQNKIDEIILLKERLDENNLLLQSRVLSLLNLLITDSQISLTKIGVDYQVISAAKRFIEKHLEEKITLHDIANSVGLSDYYFHNNFAMATGITPHQYLIECRIEKAKKLLWNTETSMNEIAEKCGFCSQQHFNKIFKKETKISPGNYRKELQNNYMKE